MVRPVSLPLRAAVLLIAGCGSRSTYIETGAPPPSYPREVRDVDVYTATAPKRSFREAGLIESRQASGWSTDDENDVVQELRRAAGARGCDGVILTGSADSVVGASNVGSSGLTSTTVTTLKGYRAVCIVYTDKVRRDPKQAAMADAGVTRRWNARGHWQLGMTVTGPRVAITFTGMPTLDATSVHVELALKLVRASSTDASGPRHQSCELELVADGEGSTARDRRFEATLTTETVQGDLALAHLQRAIAAQSATLAACDTQVSLSDATKQRLSRFVERFQAELEPGPEASTAEPAKLEL